MRIILSRKGFDSQYGGQPSPILSDGTLLSLPIPAKDEKLKFEEISYSNRTYLEIIKELNQRSKTKDGYTCHLDPDIRAEMIPRESNWLPLFGQTGGAQGHLSKNEIKKGDLFLFFGWFRETEYIDGCIKYKKNAPDLHVIFGYLQIGDIYSDYKKFPIELLNHAHAQKKYENDKNNVIYKATTHLSFLPSVAGGGCLNYHPDLVLTKKGNSRSKWKLPSLFNNLIITYHTKKSFVDDYFKSAAKGQEFIVEESNLVTDWAKDLILKGTK
jgi:hypothetical protein